MAQPAPDQAQMAQEVLAGTREISGSSAVNDPPAPSAQDMANQQAMDIATPEFRAQVNATEQTGYSLPNQSPIAPDVGVESKSIDRLPDPYDTKAVEVEREQKRIDISGPGE